MISFIPTATKYWFRLDDLDPESYISKAYKESVLFPGKNWAMHIKNLLCVLGFEHVWNEKDSQNRHKIIRLLYQKLSSTYVSNWLSFINRRNNSGSEQGYKLRTYKLFKQDFIMENYLLGINCNKRREFTKLRISAHSLQIELGRYSVPKTPADARYCKLCHAGNIGKYVEDEMHFMLKCSSYDDIRKILSEKLSTFTKFINLTDMEKFIFLMSYNSGDVEIMNPVMDYVNKAIERCTYLLTTI